MNSAPAYVLVSTEQLDGTGQHRDYCMIDTHCHLDTEAFDADRSEVLQRAFDNGLQAVVIPAIEPEHFDRVIALSASDPRIYCGVGIHPHNALQADDRALRLIEELLSSERAVAVGEIGLDYYYDFAPRDVQRRVLREQIAIAKQHNLPVILHNRDSDDDMLDIIKEEQDGTLRGVLHCFSSTPETAQRALDLGMTLSFTGNITYKKSTLGATVQAVPIERIMLETDAPYMAPVPHRGKRNEPAFVRHVAEKIAELHSLSFDEVLSMTTQTAKRLFGLALLLILVWPFAAQAQSDDDTEDDYQPRFHKVVGIGGVLGPNTIVETPEGGGDISYDGLLAYGGVLAYQIIPNIGVELSMMYSKNTKVLEKQAEPNTHTVIDLAATYNFKPDNRLSFFAALGPSYFLNSYNGESESLTGINFGVGLLGNIDSPVGVFAPTIEWRVSMMLGSRERTNIETGKKITVNFFSSIPRFKLMWYPPL